MVIFGTFMNNHVIKWSTCETQSVIVGRCPLSAYVYDSPCFRTYDRQPTHRPRLIMSTNPTTTTEPQRTTTQTTEISARRGTDPWAAPNEEAGPPSTRAQRQFEPTHRERLRNLTDKKNAYCGG